MHKSSLIESKCRETQVGILELKDPIDLQFRLMIAGRICRTHRLSNVIDILLQPFIKYVKSFVRDDIHYSSFIPNNVSAESNS